jgi:hypothetical protein
MAKKGHSQKLCTFTSKELQTVRAAQELLGAPTIGGGSASPGGGGGGSQKKQISLPSRSKCTKTVPKQLVSHTH